MLRNPSFLIPDIITRDETCVNSMRDQNTINSNCNNNNDNNNDDISMKSKLYKRRDDRIHFLEVLKAICQYYSMVDTRNSNRNNMIFHSNNNNNNNNNSNGVNDYGFDCNDNKLINSNKVYSTSSFNNSHSCNNNNNLESSGSAFLHNRNTPSDSIIKDLHCRFLHFYRHSPHAHSSATSFLSILPQFKSTTLNVIQQRAFMLLLPHHPNSINDSGDGVLTSIDNMIHQLRMSHLPPPAVVCIARSVGYDDVEEYTPIAQVSMFVLGG